MRHSASPQNRHDSAASASSRDAVGAKRGFEVHGQATPSRHRLADIALAAPAPDSAPTPVAQRRVALGRPGGAPAASRGGLPADLRTGIESLSGVSMEGVRVHYNSPKPAQLKAEAYAQGREIHLAPGRDRHLPHEAWHLAQQAQGRVQATMQAKGQPINDSPALEREADTMGQKALQIGRARNAASGQAAPESAAASAAPASSVASAAGPKP
ncbi:MAG: DUF4157 domain-containing protein [Acidobacteriota bacterium]